MLIDEDGPRKTDLEKTEILKRIGARWGDDSMKIDSPRFCGNCKQYEALVDSEYCKRCEETLANHGPVKSGRVLLWAAIFIVGVAAVLFTVCQSPR